MKCTNCGFEQEKGKFCGQCGAPVSAAINSAASVTQAIQENDDQHGGEQAAGMETTFPDQTAQGVHQVHNNVANNDTMDNMKKTTKAYGKYFVEYLKHPSLIFSKKENGTKNGLISMGIVAFLIAISIALLVRNLLHLAYGDYGGVFSDSYYAGPSVFSLFGYAFIFLIISIAIVLCLLYVVNQFFGTAFTFKEMVSVYGAHLVPAIGVAVLAFILILLKSNTVGGYLLLLAFGLVVTTFPVYLISSLLTKRSRSLDPLYGYLIYMVLMGIAFTIFAFILMDSAFGQMLDEISY